MTVHPATSPGSASTTLQAAVTGAPAPAPAEAAAAAPGPPPIVGSHGPDGAPTPLVAVRLITINDFHGNMEDSDEEGPDGRPIGGAATLAAHIRRLRDEVKGAALVVSAGDAVGAAPPISSLLRHESSMRVLDAMGVQVSTPGNHEFDRGFAEAMRLILGDKRAAELGIKVPRAPKGERSIGKSWSGSAHPWVSANIIDAKTGKPVFEPYRIVEVNGVKVAIVGAVTAELKQVTVASGIRNLKALDPAKAINALIPEIRAQGVETIVVLTHEGGDLDDKGAFSGPIVDVMKRLDPAVDAVVSGHTHKRYATQVDGRWVVQSGHRAEAVGVLDLMIDPKTGDVAAASATTVTNDEEIEPDPEVARLVSRFGKVVEPLVERPISRLPGPVHKSYAKGGMETPMGTLVAEAQKWRTGADIALMNSGGVRDDIDSADIGQSGVVRWGDLFDVQPFGNRVLLLKIKGKHIRQALEQMFIGRADRPEYLQLAGIRVKIDMKRPPGKRVVSVRLADGRRLDPDRTYKVAANNFIAEGGDGYSALRKGKVVKDFGEDLDVLVAYLSAGQPVPTRTQGRYTIVGGPAPEAGH